ncbi:cell division protein FtsI/penicillin-binding protein 2 [Perkinsela sp. CCAP 1560/4]|nr:cell division protein FtsI/penicillin-binding protein 2 [Perkinsela sp. CCAP 1560/4]|eukprot:KNH09384.1 cell division protein FtsI/penicillin-binding protein 2 [Perkinsela sp. CCAP 1560/4]
MVGRNVSGDGYVSRNRAYQRRVDDRLRPSFDEGNADESHEVMQEDKSNIRHRDRREREGIILEYEEELRRQSFTEEEIINLVHEFRKSLKARGTNSRSHGKGRYGLTKEHRKLRRGREGRVKNQESARKFAEAFNVHSGPVKHGKQRNPVDDVFDLQFKESRRQLARDKRIEAIWKNKALMKKLRNDVYTEEYRKIFGCDPKL